MSNVKHIAFVRKDNGEITSLMFSKASNNPPEGTDANDSNLEVVYITDVIERGDVFIQSKYRDFDNGVWLDRDSKPNSTYRRYVERCLADQGYDVVGWD